MSGSNSYDGMTRSIDWRKSNWELSLSPSVSGEATMVSGDERTVSGDVTTLSVTGECSDSSLGSSSAVVAFSSTYMASSGESICEACLGNGALLYMLPAERGG